MRAIVDRWVRERSRFDALVYELIDASKSTEAIKHDAESRRISYHEAAGGRTVVLIWAELDRTRADLIGHGSKIGILAEIEAQARKELGYKD